MTVIVGLPEQPANATITAMKTIRPRMVDLPVAEFIQKVCASKIFLSSGISAVGAASENYRAEYTAPDGAKNILIFVSTNMPRLRRW
jgi:hypothetical protein